MPPALAHGLFWACVALCALGQGGLLWAAVRRYERTSSTYDEDRRSGERRHGERWSPDRRTELAAGRRSAGADLAWTILPAIALVVLLAATWAALP